MAWCRAFPSMQLTVTICPPLPPYTSRQICLACLVFPSLSCRYVLHARDCFRIITMTKRTSLRKHNKTETWNEPLNKTSRACQNKSFIGSKWSARGSLSIWWVNHTTELSERGTYACQWCTRNFTFSVNCLTSHLKVICNMDSFAFVVLLFSLLTVDVMCEDGEWKFLNCLYLFVLSIECFQSSAF